MSFRGVSTALFLAMGLAACGGGGGSTTAPTPPSVAPPPPPNQPPSLSIQITPNPVLENEPFFIDLTASDDPDGTIVRSRITQRTPNFYVAEQISGDTSTAGSYTFNAPEVFRHERVETSAELFFEIEIEDNDGRVVDDEVRILVDSVQETDRAAGLAEFLQLSSSEEVLLFPENVPTASFLNVFGYLPDPDPITGDQEIVLLENLNFIPLNLIDTEIVVEKLDDTVANIGPFFPGIFSLDLSPGTRQQFALIDEQNDIINWFAAFDPSAPKNYELDTVINIDAPCYVEGANSTEGDAIWVGQRQNGLSVFRIEADRPNGGSHQGFDATLISRAEIARSLCFIYPTRLGNEAPSGARESNLDDVIAVDFDSLELVLLGDTAMPAEEYDFIKTIAIDTDGLSNLEIIDVLAVGAPGSIPKVIWILLTDGQVNGEHRLTMIWQESDGTIHQRPHTFEGGVPKVMHQTLFFPNDPNQSINAGADIIIISSTSSEVTIFEDEAIDVAPNSDLVPVYRAPITYDVGEVPASSALISLPTVNGASQARTGLVVTLSGSDQMRVVTYMD